MKTRRVERLGVREGYDRWAATYDEVASALVVLERRHTLRHLRPRRGERILDAGCGTGAHLRALERVGAHPVGIDLSAGMLVVARRHQSAAMLVQADLNRQLPLVGEAFDAALCALVSEHLTDLATFFGEVLRLLRPAGRLVFSAFHPEMAAAGVEANFERGGVEYRLGAEQHTTSEYVERIEEAGFQATVWREYAAGRDLLDEAPGAEKYLGRPLLLIIEADRPA